MISSQVCTTPEQARHLIDRAMRIAQAERSVTAVIFPNDVQEAKAVEPPARAWHDPYRRGHSQLAARSFPASRIWNAPPIS